MNSRICNPKDPCMLHAICLMYSEHREEGSTSSLLLILHITIPLALGHRGLLLIHLRLLLALLLLFLLLPLLSSLSRHTLNAKFCLQVNTVVAVFVGAVGLVGRAVESLSERGSESFPAVALASVVLWAVVSGFGFRHFDRMYECTAGECVERGLHYMLLLVWIVIEGIPRYFQMQMRSGEMTYILVLAYDVS
jgi:hypothetical protein